MVKNRGVRIAALLLVGVVCFAIVNLVTDGGFESPVVGPGGFQTGFQTFTVGQTFGPGWTVVGSSSGNVAVYPDTETITPGPTALNVQEGVQAVDLTGNTDNGSATGVEQIVSTSPGAQYQLTFYVGALNAQTASIIAKVNGSPVLTANNTPPSGGTTSWQLSTYSFTATGTSTTLDFINNSASGVPLAGLDAVQLVQTAAPPPTTPAPSTLILMLSALLAGGVYWLWSSSRRISAL